MAHALIKLFAASAVVAAIVGPAGAQSFDNAATHEWRKVGGKTCFATHAHYGESDELPSKRGATASAIRKWETFTAWEYGAKWGSYRHAWGKTMTCDQKGSRWLCKTTAKPCRR